MKDQGGRKADRERPDSSARARFSLHEAFRICRGITLGLIKAHHTDIIHRAVRPENVLVINGEPRLMNFDLSYHLEDNRITVMPELTKLKDDGYTAPEILDGNDIDETTDFFGLGIIACELLASQRPFHSKTVACPGRRVVTPVPRHSSG